MVCRPILLHNEYVPAMIGARDWKYLAFGHHDGMTIEDAVCMDTVDSLEKLFLMTAKYEGEQYDYSTQFYFAFHNDEEKERAFWNIDIPFTFVCFLQCKNEDLLKCQKYLESEEYIQEERKTLGLEGLVEGTQILAYYSLDNSDIIMVLKCVNFEYGTQLINNLHHDIGNKHPFAIRNSYSVLTLDRSYVENAQKSSLLQGSIDRMELRMIERSKSSINALYKQLEMYFCNAGSKHVLQRQALLGTEDEEIVLRNVPWKLLAPLYKEQEGILLNSNSCTQNYVNAITSIILYPVDRGRNDEGGAEVVEEKALEDNRTPFCDYLYRKIQEIYENKNTGNACTERKNLVMLVNALRKVEYSHNTRQTFNDYCFFTVFFPTWMFISLRENNSDNSVEYYEFIKYVKLCMQNFSKPDRIFLQITDLNIRYFDIPSKLVALYNAYLYYAKKLLNGQYDGQYEFLLCAGMNKITEVKELYPQTLEKEKHRPRHLFRVEIPESHTYKLKLMFITLGHEVSHFVGRSIRNREYRYQSIVKMSGRMVTIMLKEYLAYVDVFHSSCFEEDIWNAIEQDITGWIESNIQRYLDPYYLKGAEYDPELTSEESIQLQRKYYEEYYQHTSVLKVLLENAIDDMLCMSEEKIFDAFIWTNVEEDIQSGKIGREEKNDYYQWYGEEIRYCINAIRGRRGMQESELTVSNGVAELLYLLEECYADICCIMQLHLSLKEYLYNFVGNLSTTGNTVKDIAETRIITRIAIVMSVMHYDISARTGTNRCFVWDDSELVDDSEAELFELQKMAMYFTEAYIKNDADIPLGKMIECSQRINMDQKILQEVIRYLLSCRVKYYCVVQADKEQKVRRFLDLSNMSSADQFFGQIVTILEEYERDIYADALKLQKDEEGIHGDRCNKAK